jgi:hypothetical protein
MRNSWQVKPERSAQVRPSTDGFSQVRPYQRFTDEQTGLRRYRRTTSDVPSDVRASIVHLRPRRIVTNGATSFITSGTI